MRQARSTEEWACSEATTTRRSGLAVRAAHNAASVEIEAVSSMWPCHVAGKPSSWPSHESVSSSSSVTAGEVRQSMPFAFIVAARSSARIPGCDAVIAEVGEEPRVVPVRDPGQQHAIEVGEHVRERLGGLGRRGRQARADVTGLDRRHHVALADALEVVRRPVDRGVAVGPELLRIRHAREASVRPRS